MYDYIHLTTIDVAKGQFNPGKATARTPLTAFTHGSMQRQVYWRDLEGRVVFLSNSNTWHGPPKVIDNVGPGYQFAIVGWDSGRTLRLYNQEFAGSVVETSSDDGGKTWYAGKVLAKGISG